MNTFYYFGASFWKQSGVVCLIQINVLFHHNALVSVWSLLCSYGQRTYTATPGRVAQSVGHLTHKSGVLGSIPGLATYFRFSFRFFKKGSCQLLAKVCA